MDHLFEVIGDTEGSRQAYYHFKSSQICSGKKQLDSIQFNSKVFKVLARILLPFVTERVLLIRVALAAVGFGEYGLLADPVSLLLGGCHLLSLELVYLTGGDEFCVKCFVSGFSEFVYLRGGDESMVGCPVFSVWDFRV